MFGVLATADAQAVTWIGTFPSVMLITYVRPVPGSPVVIAHVPRAHEL